MLFEVRYIVEMVYICKVEADNEQEARQKVLDQDDLIEDW